MKSKISPRNFICEAIEIYANKTLGEILNGGDMELRLKAVAFSLKELSLTFGNRIETKVSDDYIYFYIGNMLFYVISDNEFKDVCSAISWTFKLFIHWGNIMKILEEMKQDKNSIPHGSVQTSLYFKEVI